MKTARTKESKIRVLPGRSTGTTSPGPKARKTSHPAGIRPRTLSLPLGQGLQELGSTQIWWEERDGTELSTAFLANALGYLEVPFAFSGTTRLGMDAIGLLYRAYLETTRQRLPRAMTELLALGTEIATEDIRRGDLVFFRNNGEIYHVGIAMGNDFFLHSAPEGAFRGVKADSLSDNSYGPRYAFARRLFAPQPPRIMVELSGEHNEYILPQNQLRGTDIPLEIRVLGEETRLELLFYRNGRLQYRKYKTLVEGRTWENLHMGLNGEWEIRLLHGNTERGRIRYQVVAGNQQTSE